MDSANKGTGNGNGNGDILWSAVRRWTLIIMMYVGIGGVIYETLWANVDRPWLLAAFLAMMGVSQSGFGAEALNDVLGTIFGKKK